MTIWNVLPFLQVIFDDVVPRNSDLEVPSAENSQLLKFLSAKPQVDQSIASHVSPAVRNSAFVIPAFPVHSVEFIFLQLLWT